MTRKGPSQPHIPNSATLSRRGFIVFLLDYSVDPSNFALDAFQSPEGDSLFFYPCLASQIGRNPHLVVRVSVLNTTPDSGIMRKPPFLGLKPHLPSTFPKFEHRHLPPKPGGCSNLSLRFRYLWPCFQSHPLPLVGRQPHLPSIAKTPPTPLDTRIFTPRWPPAPRAAPLPHW